MKPVEFDEQNIVMGEDQPECGDLPAYKEKETGEVISCWKLNVFERVKLLFTGKLWVRVSTLNEPIQPQLLSVNKWLFLNKRFFKKREEEKRKETRDMNTLIDQANERISSKSGNIFNKDEK